MNEIYNLIKDYCIALYKTGSNVIPFLHSQRDTEYHLYCKDLDDFAKCLELTEYKIKFLPFILKPYEIYSYQYYYEYNSEHYGQDILEMNYSILDHKKEYIDSIIGFYYENHSIKDKKWYHILIGLYILENNSYTLTEEQIQEIQLAHDGCLSINSWNFAKNKIKDYIFNYSLISLSEDELEIYNLKKQLTDSDYQAIKFAEGELTEEEFEPIRIQRKQWRIRINELEAKLK